MKSLSRLYSKITKSDEIPIPVRATIKVLSHWIFQGIPRMDRYERTFKLLCTGTFSVVFYSMGLHPIIALLAGHSINFVSNSHPIAAMKPLEIPFYKERDKFDRYASALLDDLVKYDWVSDVYVAGSVNRDEWHPGSDLDLIVVREPGLKRGIKGVLRAMVARFTAAINLFPIDMYVFDEEALREREIHEDLVPYEPSRK